MVDNIDDKLALTILRDYCKGMSIQDVPLQVSFDLESVGKSMITLWETAVHDKINRDSLNDFLMKVKWGNEVFVKQNVSKYIQFDTDVLVGEVLMLQFDNAGNKLLMKMFQNEYLILNETKQVIVEAPWSKLESNTCNIYALHPCRTFRLLNRMWISDFYRNNVTNNLWPLFNGIRECIENDSFESSWRELLRQFSNSGLGIFAFYMLTNAILKYQ